MIFHEFGGIIGEIGGIFCKFGGIIGEFGGIPYSQTEKRLRLIAVSLSITH
ncbi:hypothetical protein [Peribacillus asahii]|uniref:hypothetical protein n=1 Tax=Peribacillus asahii TaxID=228899 RepID=UPI0015FAC2BE|nr:hypothetical protein [Peribacillus asahii]